MAETPFANLTRVTLAEQQATIMKLNNKVAVITGAGRGIGEAVAERYVRKGAKVVIADLNKQGADAVAATLGPNAIGLKLDVTDRERLAGWRRSLRAKTPTTSSRKLTI
jgi:NAD(P)-dependent dehydrogenase (short-subunit alcohol dehydrogenase family)